VRSVSGAELPNWTPEAVGRTGYTLAWNDEFDGTTLDLSKWDPKDEAWPDNGEKQYYSPSAVTVSDGTLKIRASHEPMGGRQYTSGRIDTSKSVQFKHGIYAARLKPTYSQGLWPAWWMFGTGPKYSEIDVFELVGGNSALTGTGSGDDSAYGALTHFSVEDRPTPRVTHGPGASFHAPAGEKFADNFHVMWLEWTDTEVYMGLDGNSRMIIANISELVAFEAHMYLILNVAIGGNFPGDPDATTVMPQNFEVDWVRVYAKNGENIMVHGPAPPEPGKEGSSTGSGNTAGGGAGTSSGSSGSDSDSTGTNGGSSADGGNGNTDGGNTDSSGNGTPTNPSTGGGGDGSGTDNGDGGNNGLPGSNNNSDLGSSASTLHSSCSLLALVAAALMLML
jgi:beta-glucanase (GH16 family)